MPLFSVFFCNAVFSAMQPHTQQSECDGRLERLEGTHTLPFPPPHTSFGAAERMEGGDAQCRQGIRTRYSTPRMRAGVQEWLPPSSLKVNSAYWGPTVWRGGLCACPHAPLSADGGAFRMPERKSLQTARDSRAGPLATTGREGATWIAGESIPSSPEHLLACTKHPESAGLGALTCALD